MEHHTSQRMLAAFAALLLLAAGIACNTFEDGLAAVNDWIYRRGVYGPPGPYPGWSLPETPEPNTVPEISLDLSGDETTYRGSMHWEQFGADVAPDLAMCSEIDAGGLVDEARVRLRIDPDTRRISGDFQGHVAGYVSGPEERNEGSFESAVMDGEAFPLEGGHWGFTGLVDARLTFSTHIICLHATDSAPIPLILDGEETLTVRAHVDGDTRNGVCIWWLEADPNGDPRRELVLYSVLTMDGNCYQRFQGSGVSVP
jgi:hypothetical protein